MGYDDLKEFEGEEYTGMSVGGEHSWIYPHGLWRERKVAPDRWEFTFTSLKERERSAPEVSGVPPKTQYHWYILAHQRVRKIDQDTFVRRIPVPDVVRDLLIMPFQLPGIHLQRHNTICVQIGPGP